MQWDIYAAAKPQHEKDALISHPQLTHTHIITFPPRRDAVLSGGSIAHLYAGTIYGEHKNAVKTFVVIQCELVPIRHHVRGRHTHIQSV